MSISVIIPSYKEAENLKIILPELIKVLNCLNLPFEILIVDTMQPIDTTKQICELYNCIYVNREKGNNYGDAIRTGIEAVTKEKIVIMDADGSHAPKYINDFYKIMTESCCDIVIGSRYIKGGNSHNGAILKLMSYMVNVCYRVVFHLKVKDVSNSFRMYDSAKLKSITLQSNNFDIVEEILIKLTIKYKKLLIVEFPIYFQKRLYGESKRDLLKFILSYISTIVKMYRIKKAAQQDFKSNQ